MKYLPGSIQAREHGCTCSPEDNREGRGFGGIKGVWVFSPACPIHRNSYPIVLKEDRYSGTYSGGRWIAIAKAEVLPEAPWDSDDEASAFWYGELPDDIAVGATPEEALANLQDKGWLVPPTDSAYLAGS